MKSILMSVKPQAVARILNGKQKIIVAKTAPKETPFRVYVYCTKGRSNSRLYKEANTDGYFLDREGWRGGDYEKRYLCGKVVAEFIVDKVDKYLYAPDCYNEKEHMYYIKSGTAVKTCLLYKELCDYGKGKNLYGLHITNLKIYDKPKELKEFVKICSEWDKGKFTSKCRKCEHYFRNDYDMCYDCDCEGEIHITRPPQNFVYIREA